VTKTTGGIWCNVSQVQKISHTGYEEIHNQCGKYDHGDCKTWDGHGTLF